MNRELNIDKIRNMYEGFFEMFEFVGNADYTMSMVETMHTVLTNTGLGCGKIARDSGLVEMIYPIEKEYRGKFRDLAREQAINQGGKK